MFTERRKWRALCPDGRIRTAVEVANPDVWFAARARVQVRGRTVTGAVSAYSDAVTTVIGINNGQEVYRLYDDDAPADRLTGERTVWEFRPYTYLTNGNVFNEQIGAER